MQNVACENPRGTIDKETDRHLHLSALRKQKTNEVVEQKSRAGENEVSRAKRLLRAARLENKIVSGDAIFAQRKQSE